VAKIKGNDILKLVVSIAVCQSAGVIGSLFTAPNIPNWYAALEKPSFTPPSWIFAPVWLSLYTLMGISAFLVWRKGLSNPKVARALGVFLIQLILNALWSFLFFGLQSPLAGMIDIFFLLGVIILTAALFYRISNVAGILLIPYILWASFATVLNVAIYSLNS
jgi:tryptophan-rich sensory protein